MTPFANPTDIKIGRPLTTSEAELATELLDRASTTLRLRVPGIDALVAADPLRAAKAKHAVLAAVERVLRNPEAAKQYSETDGPFNRSVSVADSLASGLLYFTAEDLYGLAIATTSTVPRTARIRSGYPHPHRHG